MLKLVKDDDDVIVCVFRKCIECGKDVLVLWHEDPALIEIPQSCAEHAP